MGAVIGKGLAKAVLGKAGQVEHAGAVGHGGVGSNIQHGNFIFDVIKSLPLNECLK